MAEYATLLALLAIVVILAINTMAPAISNSFTQSGQAIETAGIGTDGGGGSGDDDGHDHSGSGNDDHDGHD
jgi:Flp pilus assembly pilin Flp